MKKLLLMISMLAVVFSMSACTETSDETFEYDEAIIADYTESLVEYYIQASKEQLEYYEEAGTTLEVAAAKGISQLERTDKITTFGMFDSSKTKIEENGDVVTVTVVNKAEGRDVEFSVNYEENKSYNMLCQQIRNEIRQSITDIQLSYGYSEQEILEMNGYASFEEAVAVAIYESGYLPFEAKEIEINAVYSKSETMKQAGMNTIIGMGTVFGVLIFISFIISLLKYVPRLVEKKSKKEDVSVTTSAITSVPVAPVSTPAFVDDLMNDNELVAVITAAIYAESASNGTSSKDTLVVRSIKRARK